MATCQIIKSAAPGTAGVAIQVITVQRMAKFSTGCCQHSGLSCTKVRATSVQFNMSCADSRAASCPATLNQHIPLGHLPGSTALPAHGDMKLGSRRLALPPSAHMHRAELAVHGLTQLSRRLRKHQKPVSAATARAEAGKLLCMQMPCKSPHWHALLVPSVCT